MRLPEGEPHPLVAAGQTVWVPATSERHPGPRPVVLVLDGAKRVGTRWRTEGVTVVGAGERALDHAFALLAFDAVVVRSNAWRDDDPDAATKARALADYVRKGGLLIGPATSRPWPAALGRALHAAARGQVRGPDGVLTLGLGRVTRAETQDDVREILAADLWVPEVGTKLAGPLPPAPMPSDRFRWHDDPKERRTLGYLLLLHAAAVALLTWLVRRRDLQIGALLLAAGAIGMGLVWITPRAVHLRVEGLVTELGGPGGRRHEAVVLSAGPEGYVGQVTWRRGGVIQRLGGAVDEAGRLRILPGRTVWLIREDPAGPGRTPDAEDRAAGWLRPLLVGAVDPRRLRFGRGAPLPIQIEGLGPIPASSVAWRRP